MACTAKGIIGGFSVPSLPVKQIVDRGLGEAVEGATSSCSSRVCIAQPQATYCAPKIASEMTLIALYDVGAHVAELAHGAVPALLAAADGHLSRRAAHNRWV